MRPFKASAATALLCLACLALRAGAGEPPAKGGWWGRLMSRGRAALEAGGNKVAVVPIDGPIVDARDTVRWLRSLGRDVPGLKAVVLAIDSPGGGVAASQELFNAVKRLQDDGKKVVVSMGSVAASGGYYAACPADRILADPGTLTGSIGVILEVGSAEQLMKKVGLKFETVKSGRYKDSGGFFRDLRPDERAVLQQVIDDVYDQFVSAVAESRSGPLARAMGEKNPSPEEVKGYVRKLADGRVYSGRQAWDLGLVDELGDLQDAIRVAAELSGIKGEPRVITERRRTGLADMLSGLLHLDPLKSLEPALSPGLRLSYKAW
jgi:protease-4